MFFQNKNIYKFQLFLSNYVVPPPGGSAPCFRAFKVSIPSFNFLSWVANSTPDEMNRVFSYLVTEFLHHHHSLSQPKFLQLEELSSLYSQCFLLPLIQKNPPLSYRRIRNFFHQSKIKVVILHLIIRVIILLYLFINSF